MADQTPGTPQHDPIDDRLRATFAAERHEVEARHLHRGPKLNTIRSVSWMPLAAAAAVIAIAALAFAGFNRTTDDQAVELAIAEQPTATPVPSNPVPVDEGDPAAPTPPAVTASPTPNAPAVTPAENNCGARDIPTDPHFVWGVAVDDADGGLVAHFTPGVDEPITRVLPYNAVAQPTGGCALTDNGAEWYELATNGGGTDWVNARFLMLARPTCLLDESIGAETRNGAAPTEFFHTVAAGDFLVQIAERYNITVEALIDKNPDIDFNILIAGQLLRVPGALTSGTKLLGPLTGWGAYDGDVIAFATSQGIGSDSYLWHSGTATFLDGECSDSQLRGLPVCLVGNIVLDTDDGSWSGAGPVTAWRTGRSNGPLIEFELLDPTGELVTGFLNPVANDAVPGHCVPTGSHALADAPCTRVLRSTDEDPLWIASQGASQADHVHDLRTESNDDCTRLVVEFGANANEDADQPTALLPEVTVEFGPESVIIRPVVPRAPTFPEWEGAFDDADRVDYPGGIGLLVVSTGFEFSVQFNHQEMEPHVRFMSDPARVVVDLFPVENADPDSRGPSGNRFILREPIQKDLTGPGIPSDIIVVAGYGRPFEAQGQYRIWSVPADVDPEAFLVDPPEPLVKEVLRTSSWSDGWGEFFVGLPDLGPGTYIAVFGDEPPTDEIGFYGTGQLFRIADPDDPVDADYPPAVLLPDVQLPPGS